MNIRIRFDDALGIFDASIPELGWSVQGESYEAVALAALRKGKQMFYEQPVLEREKELVR